MGLVKQTISPPPSSNSEPRAEPLLPTGGEGLGPFTDHCSPSMPTGFWDGVLLRPPPQTTPHSLCLTRAPTGRQGLAFRWAQSFPKDSYSTSGTRAWCEQACPSREAVSSKWSHPLPCPTQGKERHKLLVPTREAGAAATFQGAFCPWDVYPFMTALENFSSIIEQQPFMGQRHREYFFPVYFTF